MPAKFNPNQSKQYAQEMGLAEWGDAGSDAFTAQAADIYGLEPWDEGQTVAEPQKGEPYATATVTDVATGEREEVYTGLTVKKIIRDAATANGGLKVVNAVPNGDPYPDLIEWGE